MWVRDNSRRFAKQPAGLPGFDQALQCCSVRLLTTATNAVMLLLLALQVREPVAGVFSAETMLRGMGAPLTWTLAQQPAGSVADEEAGVDQKFKVGSQHASCLGVCALKAF